MRLSLIFLAVGCTAEKTAPDDIADDTADDTAAETGDSGVDTSDACLVGTPTATFATDLVTVMTVAWTTKAPGTSVVEWGYDESYGYQTNEATSASDAHRVVVAGMAPGTQVHWRVRSQDGEATCVSDGQIAQVSRGYEQLGPMSLDLAGEGYSRGFRLLPVSGNPASVVIIDDEAREVWGRPMDEGVTAVQAWMDKDNTHVLYLAEDSARLRDISGIYRVSLDQSDVQFLPLHYAHHGFRQLSDGRFLYLATDPREVDGEMVAGDALMIVDADGGNSRVVYSTWDQFTPDMPRLIARGGTYYPNWLDWTHANSLSIRDDGSVLLSLHNISTIVNVDLDGNVYWTLMGAEDGAGQPGDFRFDGSVAELFARQHNPIPVGDHNLLLFDNGPGGDDDYAEVAEYTLDETNYTFARVWNFDWDQAHEVAINGDVQRFPNGNTLAAWGSNGRLNEITPAGEIVWQASAGSQVLGFLQQYASLGGPVE